MSDHDTRDTREPLPYTPEEMVLIRGMRTRGLFVNPYEQRMLATIDARDAERDAMRAERDEAQSHLDEFMAMVGEALLGPPEKGTEWGGGGILDGIKTMRREAGEARMAIAHRNLVVLDQASLITELRARIAKLEAMGS